MDIRVAQQKDFDEIYQLVQTAFATANVKDGTEQDFVLALRAGDGYLPALEFVAEEDGKLIGHVMLTKKPVKTPSGQFAGLLLAPLCVALEYRSQGVGSRLVRHSMAEAKTLGYTGVFLAGDPAYYGRFGFRAIDRFGIQNDSPIPDQFVLGCEIAPGGLEGARGVLKID